MVQKNFTVAESVKYLVGKLVVVVLLHDTRVVDQQRPIVHWPQTELCDACARLAVCLRVLGGRTLCHRQVEDGGRGQYGFIFEIAVDERGWVPPHIAECLRVEIRDPKQVARASRHDTSLARLGDVDL